MLQWEKITTENMEKEMFRDRGKGLIKKSGRNVKNTITTYLY